MFDAARRKYQLELELKEAELKKLEDQMKLNNE